MRGLQPRLSNFIQLQDVCVFPGNGIYIHPVNQFFDEDLGCLSRVHDQISLIQLHRLLIHPAEVSLKLILNDWNIILPDNHVATAYIDLILQGTCDGISRHRFLQVSILRYDLLDPAAHSGRQGEDLLSRLDSPDATLPENPLKFLLGRMTYWTGKRKSTMLCEELTFTVSRWCSKAEP